MTVRGEIARKSVPREAYLVGDKNVWLMADSLPQNSTRSSLSVLYAISHKLPSSAICSFLRTRYERRFTRKRSGSAIAAAALMSNEG